MLYSYDPVTQNLWQKLNGNEPKLLGCIFNYKGGKLTRLNKLRIIQANGKWINV